MVPTRELTPYVPITPKEIINESLELSRRGAAIVHLHARDGEGKPTWSKEIYQRIICGIREKNADVIVCVSTSGRLWQDFERRSEVLELTGDAKPDMASVTPGSMNFLQHASLNPPDVFRDLLRKMNDCGIKPELEVFDSGMMAMIPVLRRESVVHGRAYVNVLLGNLGTAPADLGVLSTLVEWAEKDAIIAVSGIGRAALPAHMTAIAAGLHVRVGLEDGLYMDMENETLATNAALLERVTSLAKMLNRPIATAIETRELLGL